MRAVRRRRRSSIRSRELGHLGKPRGILSPRVQAVGPERFGIVGVDCAKARSKWMVTDFYGRVLVPPTLVEHHRAAFDEALVALGRAIAAHDLQDLVVAVERTGRYHLPLLRAFTTAGYDTRVVHPSISRHFREAATYDNKTDDTDLEGICRSAINGFGLQEQGWDPVYSSLQFWARCRRDLVAKTTLLRCQILEHLEACLPGYSRCFENVFKTKIALLVLRRFATPQAIVQAGLPGLTQLARLGRVQVHRRTLARILGWAQNAPAPDGRAPLFQHLVCALNDDRIAKEKQIRSIEQELVSHLVQTPYVRLLALPGISVVLASEFAAEAGPMVHYATARVITGRAGLYPRRYQSDEVDHASGSLARRGNRRLRQALLLAASTLLRCNDYFGVLAAKWTDQGKDPRDIHVRVAGRYVRIAFQMVTGTAGFCHPACQGPPAVLSKLIEFHNVHGIESDITRANLQRAAAQLPRAEQVRERVVLDAQLEAARGSRGRGPKRLSQILPAVLEHLGVTHDKLIQSTTSGETP
jgi:transposase